jgi:hypothetical protein
VESLAAARELRLKAPGAAGPGFGSGNDQPGLPGDRTLSPASTAAARSSVGTRTCRAAGSGCRSVRVPATQIDPAEPWLASAARGACLGPGTSPPDLMVRSYM